MHLIDQELSGINQLGAIVGAISGYLSGKQFGQLFLTVDWQTICGEKMACKWEIWLQSMKIRKNQTSPASDVISISISTLEISCLHCSTDVLACARKEN